MSNKYTWIKKLRPGDYVFLHISSDTKKPARIVSVSEEGLVTLEGNIKIATFKPSDEATCDWNIAPYRKPRALHRYSVKFDVLLTTECDEDAKLLLSLFKEDLLAATKFHSRTKGVERVELGDFVSIEDPITIEDEHD